MTHELRAHDALRLVEVVYHGPLDAHERERMIAQGAHLLSQRQFRRVLVDMRDAVFAQEPTHVLMKLGHTMAHAPVVQRSRLAYLVTEDQVTNMFVENMAKARHMEVARFLDRDQAIAWLVADDEASPARD